MIGEERTARGTPARSEPGCCPHDDDLRRDLHQFICETFLPMHPGVKLGDTDKLADLGVLDSIAFAELVAEVQDRYRIEVRDTDITEANFGSIVAIAGYVQRRRMA